MHSDLLSQFHLSCSETTFLSQDKQFKKQTSVTEVLLITRLVTKINKRNREQDRTIAISNENVYNLQGKSIRRKIQLRSIFAVSVSRISGEFVLHIPDEYDYRYKSVEQRDVLLQYLAAALRLNGLEGLKIYFVDLDDLEQFTLNEKSKDKSTLLHPRVPIFTLPPEHFQLQYINYMNSGKINVLYVQDNKLLRVHLSDYIKTLIIGHGSLCKAFLITQKKLQYFSTFLVLKTISRQMFDIDIDLLEFLLKSYVVEPFLTPLEICIQQQDKIHFFFKFMKAGDLYMHLREINTFTERAAKQLFSQIAMALSSLHEKGIIYGDLKPENILMDEHGYVALTDFGFGKLRIYQEIKRTKSICFTLEYCSPEYLRNGELTRMADWYSLGILLYEMLIGIPPYYHPTSQELVIKMISQGELHFPKNSSISAEAKDMIVKLLQQDTSSRLGFNADFKEISAHPWLNDINWIDLKAKRVLLDYIPNINEQQINEAYFMMEQLSEEQRVW